MIRKVVSLQGVEVAIFALLLAVIVAQSIYLITYVREQREIATTLVCQSQLNTVFREALTSRTDASARERQAQRDLLGAFAERPPPAEIERVYRRYFDVLDQADREREANPLPTTTC